MLLGNDNWFGICSPRFFSNMKARESAVCADLVNRDGCSAFCNLLVAILANAFELQVPA